MSYRDSPETRGIATVQPCFWPNHADYVALRRALLRTERVNVGLQRRPGR
jgi:hypothetical protein